NLSWWVKSGLTGNSISSGKQKNPYVPSHGARSLRATKKSPMKSNKCTPWPGLSDRPCNHSKKGKDPHETYPLPDEKLDRKAGNARQRSSSVHSAGPCGHADSRRSDRARFRQLRRAQGGHRKIGECRSCACPSGITKRVSRHAARPARWSCRNQVRSRLYRPIIG